MIVKVPLFKREELLNQLRQVHGGNLSNVEMETFENQYVSLIRKVTRNIRSVDIQAGCDIFNKGDIGSELFMIRKGKVNVIDGEKILVTLEEKNYFGDIALMEHTTRTATTRAATDCELCLITKDIFDELMNTNMILRNHVTHLMEKRKEERNKANNDSEVSKKKLGPWNQFLKIANAHGSSILSKRKSSVFHAEKESIEKINTKSFGGMVLAAMRAAKEKDKNLEECSEYSKDSINSDSQIESIISSMSSIQNTALQKKPSVLEIASNLLKTVTNSSNILLSATRLNRRGISNTLNSDYFNNGSNVWMKEESKDPNRVLKDRNSK
ncbi:cGMP-dependent protein kinase 1, partial [Nowakowskiella sp. JEL0078]